MTTYHQIVTELSPDIWVYRGMKSYVLTHQAYKNTDEIKFVSEDAVTLIKKLKTQEGKNIWICGGANIANQLIKDNLIDEYHLTIMPVILGNGIRLFNNENKTVKLSFVESKTENGVIDCIYTRPIK